MNKLKKSKVINSPEEWAKYCGFLDLSIEEFIAVQEKILLEHLQSVGNTTLDHRIIGKKVPESVNEFRNVVPLTTYADYLPEMGINNEDTLPEKPFVWVHTSGQGTSFLDIPYTSRFYDRLLTDLMAIFILSCSDKRGESSLQEYDRVLANVAPAPYLGGTLAAGMAERFNFIPVLPPGEHDNIDFKEKVTLGFEKSLKNGVDITIALTSVLVKMGNDFNTQRNKSNLRKYLSQPDILLRFARAYLLSKLKRRNILPKDLWAMKALIGWGMDTSIYREKVVEFWGKHPYEFHACTEAGILAMQSWTKKDLTFVPHTNFLEFIPEDEMYKNKLDPSYKPRTILLSEVEPGSLYEIVATNFHGMPFLRYRLGHLIKITSLKDEKAQINLPQISFEGRADDLIDIASFIRLSEKTITKAIASSGQNIDEWTIRKEFNKGNPVLALYLEMHNGAEAHELIPILHQSLRKVDLFYDNLVTMLDIQPLVVTILNPGTFNRYYDKKAQSGIELTLRKPPRMNAADEDINELLALSKSLA